MNELQESLNCVVEQAFMLGAHFMADCIIAEDKKSVHKSSKDLTLELERAFLQGASKIAWAAGEGNIQGFNLNKEAKDYRTQHPPISLTNKDETS